MIRAELERRAEALAERREAFVHATVVRAQRPSSVRPGDAALVLADGTIEGFVGGHCAEESVRLHALRVLETGGPLLLRILPGDGDAPAAEGAVTVRNPCLSGGGLEIFLEPRLPAARLVAVGDTPIALSLAHLGEALGYDVRLVGGGADVEEVLEGAVALVVASHGREEERALEAAVERGVASVGLVASRTRGAAVLGTLDQATAAAVRTPAGLDIGARGADEVALSILAEIVAVRRGAGAVDPRSGAAPPSAAATPEPARSGAHHSCH